MQFDDSMEHAASCLRRAIPEMVRREIPVDPMNYALWYGYVSGRNQVLVAALDAEIPDAERYSREIVDRLFFEHVVKPRIPPQAEYGEEAIGLLTELLQRVTDNASGTQTYGAALERGIETLRANTDRDTVQRTLHALLEDTHQMRESQERFQVELGAAQREIETLRDQLAHTEKQALDDSLTGIGNRRRFDLALTEALAAEGNLCLLLLDIDHFKRVNDTWGHEAGDVVLRMVGGVLRRFASEQVTVARVGGEEFGVLLRGFGSEAVEQIAERIRAAVGELHLDDPVTGAVLTFVSASLGVASRVPREGAESLFRRADSALYAAKHGGRNHVRIAA